MVNNTLASSVDSEWVQTEIDPGTIEVQRNQTEIRGQRGSFRFRQKEYSVITVATFSPDSTLHSSPHSASAVRNGKEAIGDVKKGKGVNLCHHVRMQKLLGWFGDQSADSIAPREIELHFRAE